VFVPGFMQQGGAWGPIADRVAGSHPTTWLDLESDTLEGRVDEVTAGIPAGGVAIGYSMGGRLALHAALRDPDRPAAIVTVGASAGIEDPQERERRRAADEDLAGWIETHSIEAVVKRWEAQPVFATQDPALVAAQRPARLEHSPPHLARVLRAAGQGATTPVWDRLGELRCPVLAVAGERDDVYVSAARRLSELTPMGRLAIVPGVGHAVHLEAPEAFSELLLDFLDEHLG
jgi:2-succinyl-6-hydroxy-2,4-cyclohexadiene-1-carboxylate synthase